MSQFTRHSQVGAALSLVIATAGLACSSGGESELSRSDVMANLTRAHPDASADAVACWQTTLDGYPDEDLTKVDDSDSPEHAELSSAIEECLNAPGGRTSTTTTVDTTTGDPLVDEVLADPVGWMQTRLDLAAEALCSGEPDRLDQIYALTSTDLPSLRESAGEVCPTPIVNAVTGSDDQPLDADNLRTDVGPDGMVQFYVTDSGWAGDEHKWSCYLVNEGGVLKILSSTAR